MSLPGTLVDSSILLDLLIPDSQFAAWARDQLRAQAASGFLAINPIIYAEVGAHLGSDVALQRAVPRSRFQRLPIPFRAARHAGAAHVLYRRAGGAKTTTLPDFFVGAHAAVANLRVLTRDPARIRRYFLTVAVVSP